MLGGGGTTAIEAGTTWTSDREETGNTDASFL